MDYDGHEWATPDCPMPAFVDWMARAEAAKAAIQRVRELAEQRIEDMRPFMAPATLSAHEVLDALRGDSDA